MKIAFYLSFVLLLSGCVTSPDRQYPRINTRLQAVKFNSLAGANYPYPVRVLYAESMLLIYAENYSSLPSQFMIERGMVPEIVSAMNKYLEWEQLATDRNDLITKKITEIKYHAGKLVIDFHSANSGMHLFSIGLRTPLSDTLKANGISDLVLTKENVLIFRELLVAFANHDLKLERTDEIYK